MGKVITRAIPIRVYPQEFPSLWMWRSDDPDRLVVVWFGNADPTPWNVPADVLDGGIPCDEGMTITYGTDRATVILDGHDPDNHTDSKVCEMSCNAARLKEFALDVKVARSSSRFETALRGLIGG